MFIISLFLAILIGLQILIITRDRYFEKLVTSILLWTVGPFVAFILCLFLIPATGGMLSGYSEGVREGYITKFSEKGFIWKTYEAQIQVGTGELAALQAPFDFSIARYNPLYLKVQENLGKKVRIKYNEWFIMPYKIGSSGYELTDIQIIKGSVMK